MLELVSGLNAENLVAIAALESRVLAADGGRLKLEWGTLRSRPENQVSDVLVWQGDQLVGFAGLYSFGPEIEVVGMVDPAFRRQGFGAALIDVALQLGRERSVDSILLLVPRNSETGKRLAVRRGGHLDHSEHALELLTAPSPAREAAVHVRTAEPADAAGLSIILEAAFGHPVDDLAEQIERADAQILAICDADGTLVGHLRLSSDSDEAGMGIYGFAVAPERQGQGIGRHVLRDTCERLRAQGVRRIHLEVETGNDHALGLYTSLGFTPVLTEDYYAIPTR